MSLLRTPSQRPVDTMVDPSGAVTPTNEAERIGAALQAARPMRDLVPREVLESCAGALAGMGGPAARSIAVTSCHRGEGRSTVSLALGLLERTTYERHTLLVE